MTTEAAARSYSAFISYRHADADTRVAKEVHRKLERYHLDREVRARTGRKSLAPVFRDQDELPISSALDDDLVAALRNSSTLIVICSPRTRESVWVDREISEFLKTHDRSRVLVALCEGEPRDVVPERLLHKEGPDGQLVDVEPLAANFREGVTGQARRNEVSRLAAGILEVPYDSLVKRAQRRRQRIAAALASAAVAASTAFGVYNAYMNTQIKNNYDQAMQRRSQYLASEAAALIDEGNTIGATELALAALPDAMAPETLSRPVVPDAVLALQRATNAGVFGSFLERSYTTTEAYGSSADLRSFEVSPSEAYVVTVDESDYVTTWDVAEHTIVYQGRSSLGRYEEVIDAFALDSGETLIVYRNGVVLRTADGEVGWDRALTTGDERIERVGLDGATRTELLVASDEAAYALDVSTGEVVKTIGFGTLLGVGDDGWTTTTCPMRVREDRFVLAVSYGDDSGFLGCRALVVNARTLDVRVFEPEGLYAYYVGLLSDGSVVMLTGSDPDAQTSDTGVFYGTTYTKTTNFDLALVCLDPATQAVRWKNDLAIWEVSFGIGFEEQQGASGQQVICWLSDRVLYVDALTGEVQNELKCSSPLVGGGVLDDGVSFMGIERDGSLFIVTAESESVLAHDLMGNDLYMARVMPTGELYLIKGNYLYAYRGAIVDTGVSEVAVEPALETWEFAARDGFVLASMIEGRDVLRIELRDALSLDLLWEQELDGSLLWHVLGFDEEADALVAVGADVNEDGYPVREVACLQMATRDVDRLEVAHELPADVTVPAAGEAAVACDGIVVGSAATYGNGVVFSAVTDAIGHVGIAAASLGEATTKVYGVAEGFGAELSAGGKRLYLLAGPHARHLFYQNAVGTQDGESGLVVSRSAVLDLASGVSAVVDEPVAAIWDGTLPTRALKGHVTWSDDGSRLACVCSEGIVVHDVAHGQEASVALDGSRVDGTWLAGKRLVVALSAGYSGQLEAYDVETGDWLTSRPFEDGGEWVYQWTSVPEALAADGSGDVFVSTPVNGLLIDLDTLGVCQRVAGGCAYSPAHDAILCQGVDKASYHAHARYSVARLVERGHAILGSQTMGEEWLAAHGA